MAGICLASLKLILFGKPMCLRMCVSYIKHVKLIVLCISILHNVTVHKPVFIPLKQWIAIFMCTHTHGHQIIVVETSKTTNFYNMFLVKAHTSFLKCFDTCIPHREFILYYYEPQATPTLNNSENSSLYTASLVLLVWCILQFL